MNLTILSHKTVLRLSVSHSTRILIMNLLRVLAITGFLALPATSSAADNFLDPAEWEGLIKEYWTVEGNTVIGMTKEAQKFNTFLCSKKKYKDFELSFDVRLKGGTGNSGIQFRSVVTENKNFTVAGPQADIGANYWGSLYGEKFSKEGKVGGGHMMLQAPGDKVNEKLKKDDFNEYKIVCKGKHVSITVNGVKAVDADFEILPEDGIIAFQVHAGPPMEVTFKNIKFTELK